MKKLMPIMVLGLMLSLASGKAIADEYDDSQSHPLLVTARILHPFGLLLEWTIARPIHALVTANETTEYIFGHKPHPPLFDEPQSTPNPGTATGAAAAPSAP